MIRHLHKHKIGNNGIKTNFVFQEYNGVMYGVKCFLHYLDLNMLANVKLYAS